jgi:DNA-binding protein H-NS
MRRPEEEILADIDTTLDQLICYADNINMITLSELEVDALQKTQESLLARLIHMEEMLNKERKPAKQKSIENVQQKIAQYSKLNARLINGVADQFARRSNVRLKKRQSTLKTS